MSDLIRKVTSAAKEDSKLSPQTVFVEDPAPDAPEPPGLPSMAQISAALAEKRDVQKRQIKSLREALARAQEILDSMDA